MKTRVSDLRPGDIVKKIKEDEEWIDVGPFVVVSTKTKYYDGDLFYRIRHIDTDHESLDVYTYTTKGTNECKIESRKVYPWVIDDLFETYDKLVEKLDNQRDTLVLLKGIYDQR